MEQSNPPLPKELEDAIKKTLISPNLREVRRQEFIRLEKETVGIALRGKAFKRTFVFELVIFAFLLVLIIVGACMGSAGVGMIVPASIVELFVVVWGILTLVWSSRAKARINNLNEELQNELLRNKAANYPCSPLVFVYGPYTGAVRSFDVKLANMDTGIVSHFPSVGASCFVPEKGSYLAQFGKKTTQFELESEEIAIVRLSYTKEALSVSKETLQIVEDEAKASVGAKDGRSIPSAAPRETVSVERPIPSSSHDDASASPAQSEISRRPVDLATLPLAAKFRQAVEQEQQKAKSLEGVSGSAQLKRAELYLEDGDYEKANASIERVLDIDPTCSVAYLMKVCVYKGLSSMTHILLSETPLSQEKEFEKAKRFASPEFKAILEEAENYVLSEIEESKKDAVYRNAAKLEAEGKLPEAIAIYLEAIDYSDAKDRATACISDIVKEAGELEKSEEYLAAYNKLDTIDLELIEKPFPKQSKDIAKKKEELLSKNTDSIYESALAMMEEGSDEKARNTFLSLGDYRESKAKAEECAIILEEKRKEDAYQSALLEESLDLSQISSREKLSRSVTALKTISGYKDADALLARYEPMLEESKRIIAEAEEERRRVAREKVKAKRKKILLIGGVVAGSLALVTAVVLPLTFILFIPYSRLNDGKKHINWGDYWYAERLLYQNGDFANSRQLANVAEAGSALMGNNEDAALRYLSDAGYTVNLNLDPNDDGISARSMTIRPGESANIDIQKDGFFCTWDVRTFSFYLDSSCATINLVANWYVLPSASRKPIFIDNSRVEYGLYPQTKVTDNRLISGLDSSNASGPNGWKYFGGVYYAKANSDWFEVEPIKWRVLSRDGDECFLLCETLLERARYNEYFYDGSYGYYANNYARSEIREWLNGSFYDTAFALDSTYIKETLVDNSASTTDSSSGQYACENTLDKVFLLSYQDYQNADYGFSSKESRKCQVTDWAVSQGVLGEIYWTRSPYSDYYPKAWDVSGGVLNDRGVGDDAGGARPALKITVAS